MLDFLGFGKPKSEGHDSQPAQLAERTAPASASAAATPATAPDATSYPTATQREMLRITLHTLQKRHGIPMTWLGSELSSAPTPGQPQALALQLIIQRWHAGFGLYGPALQRELMDALKRFDPSISPASFAITWKFAPDCACPHHQLPDAGFWTLPAPSAAPMPTRLPPSALLAQMQPMPEGRKFDLPPSGPDDDNGFAATQLRDLR